MIYYTSDGKPYIKYASDQVAEILKALGTAQLTFKELAQSGRNSFYKDSKYSTLKDIFNACGESLKENKISIISTMARINTKNMFIQTLVHSESGQFLSSSADMGEYDNIHTVGSKITYFRRYLLQPMLNLEGDINTDDDANAGQKFDNGKTVEYDHMDGPFRQFGEKGSITEEFGDYESYTKKLANGIIKYENIKCLIANVKEMNRVLKYLNSVKVDTVAKKTAVQTLESGLKLVDNYYAQN